MKLLLILTMTTAIVGCSQVQQVANSFQDSKRLPASGEEFKRFFNLSKPFTCVAGIGFYEERMSSYGAIPGLLVWSPNLSKFQETIHMSLNPSVQKSYNSIKFQGSLDGEFNFYFINFMPLLSYNNWTLGKTLDPMYLSPYLTNLKYRDPLEENLKGTIKAKKDNCDFEFNVQVSRSSLTGTLEIHNDCGHGNTTSFQEELSCYYSDDFEQRKN